MNLNDLRIKIDALDKKIIALLNARTDLVLEVGKIKAESGKEIYAPERERQIYDKLSRISKGPLSKEALMAIYREIMSASLAMEKPLRIAYLGPEASYTHLASMSKFGSSVQYDPAISINQVFIEVEQKQADYGVVPIENSNEGAVNHTLDMFMDSDLKICSEILLEISHHLMSRSSLKKIRKVYSKREALGQCRLWLDTHLPGVDLIEMSSTTQAAQRAQKEKNAAAIASELASKIYNLPLRASGIQDYAQNVTRFLVISRQLPKASNHDKTSILVSVKDKVGALYTLLASIRKSGVNMTKIESRPSKKRAWEYYFFIDFEGHVETPKVKKMLRDMEGKVKFLKILGSYPASSKKEI